MEGLGVTVGWRATAFSERLVAKKAAAFEQGEEVLLVAAGHLSAVRALRRVSEQCGRAER